jgi:hypothetical protein
VGKRGLTFAAGISVVIIPLIGYHSDRLGKRPMYRFISMLAAL